jgi:hypothetical protein
MIRQPKLLVALSIINLCISSSIFAACRESQCAIEKDCFSCCKRISKMSKDDTVAANGRMEAMDRKNQKTKGEETTAEYVPPAPDPNGCSDCCPKSPDRAIKKKEK